MSSLFTNLLKIISQFIELQHVVNLMILRDMDSKANISNNNNERLKTISRDCSLGNNENNNQLIRKLFLSSMQGSKSCLLSPIFVNLHLDLRSSNGTTVSSSTNIDKSVLEKGFLSGMFSYGVFDYSDYYNLKKFKDNNSSSGANQDKLATAFTIPFSLRYSLSAGTKNCSLEKINSELFKTRELNL